MYNLWFDFTKENSGRNFTFMQDCKLLSRPMQDIQFFLHYVQVQYWCQEEMPSVQYYLLFPAISVVKLDQGSCHRDFMAPSLGNHPMFFLFFLLYPSVDLFGNQFFGS